MSPQRMMCILSERIAQLDADLHAAQVELVLATRKADLAKVDAERLLGALRKAVVCIAYAGQRLPELSAMYEEIDAAIAASKP